MKTQFTINRYYLTLALKITAPVFFGYISIGIPFGLMTVSSGYPIWLSFLMSVFVYAGAGQYMAMALFAAGANLLSICISILMVNIRHIVYGLSLIQKFKDIKHYKPYIIFALTDETYALMTATPLPPQAKAGPFYFSIAFLDHLYWILGSVIGATLGHLIPFDFKGVDFALTALFTVLLIEQLKATKDIAGAAIGIFSTMFAIFFGRLGLVANQNVLLLAIALGVVLLILWHKFLAKNYIIQARQAGYTEHTSTKQQARQAKHTDTKQEAL